MPRLAAVDTAKNAPHKDPAWAEEGDDGMEEVVWAVILLVHDGCLLWLGLCYHHNLLWLTRWGVASLWWGVASLWWRVGSLWWRVASLWWVAC